MIMMMMVVVMVITVVIGALGTASGGFGKWLKILGMRYNMELLQRVCFAGDRQNPEKSARHFKVSCMTVSKGKNRTCRKSLATDGGPMLCN